MATFMLKIDMDNAAFGDTAVDKAAELDGCLRRVMQQVERFGLEPRSRPRAWVLDSNGNRVGTWRVSE